MTKRTASIEQRSMGRKSEKGASTSNAAWTSAVYKEARAELERSVEQAFEDNRALLVQTLISRLQDIDTAPNKKVVVEEGSEWVEIESLSRLRGIVGGRFQNIKQRWVEAGFPLKAHRGDSAGEYKLNNEGWIELTNWMEKHGYEARINPDNKRSLFEIRKI